MRRILIAALAATALVGAPAAVAAHQGSRPHAVAAKTCSAGWRHAVIGGQQKCLRRGQFCARRYDGQYRRYGYRCLRRDSRGNYHLT